MYFFLHISKLIFFQTTPSFKLSSAWGKKALALVFALCAVFTHSMGQITVKDMFNRTLNNYQVNLVDWQGMAMNPMVKLTLTAPTSGVSYPLNVTVKADGSSRLMLDLPSTLSSTGATKSISFANSASVVTIYLAIAPDRAGGNGEIESYNLKFTYGNTTQNLPIKVLDQDDDLQPLAPVVFDYRYDNIAKLWSRAGYKTAGEAAIKDWLYYFDYTSFDMVPAGDEKMPIAGDDWQNETIGSNGQDYNGFYIFLQSINKPYSTGYPSSRYGKFLKKNGVQLPGPLFRSHAQVLQLDEIKPTVTSIADEDWYLTDVYANVDVYGLVSHEIGHAFGFHFDYAGTSSYKDNYTDYNKYKEIIDYQGYAVPLDGSAHINGDAKYRDRISGQSAGWESSFPQRRWMLTKLHLLIAKQAGWQFRNIGPFLKHAINTTTLPDGSKNTAYDQTLQSNNGGVPFYEWTITSGSLPAGLSLNSFTGNISGTITAPDDVYNFTVQLKDYDERSTPVTKQLSIKVGTTTTTPPATFSTTKCYRFNIRHSEKVMEIEGASIANGGNVQQGTWSGAKAQIWSFKDESAGFYQIVNNNSGKVLDVFGASVDDGANVIQWDWANGDNQRWKMTKNTDGYYTIAAKHSNKVLDVYGSGTQDGANIAQYPSNNANNQQFQIVETGCPTTTPTPTPTSEFDAAKCYRFNARHSGKVMEVAGGSTANGGNVQQSSWTGTKAQIWRIKDEGAGLYRIINGNSGKVLDVTSASTANGANVNQWDWLSGDNQRWKLTKNTEGYYAVTAKHSGQALTVKLPSFRGTQDGLNIYQSPNNNATNQQFEVVEAGCPTGTVALQSANVLTAQGYRDVKKAVINWVSNTKEAADYFVVEKKIANEFEYKKVDLVNAKANSNEDNQFYSIVDNNPGEGVNTYRVALHRANEPQPQYSELINLDFDNLTDYALFPNPANDYLDIDLETVRYRNVAITVSDLSGKTVLSQKVESAPTVLRVNLESLQAGQYLIQIEAENKRVVSKKLLIMR